MWGTQTLVDAKRGRERGWVLRTKDVWFFCFCFFFHVSWWGKSCYCCHSFWFWFFLKKNLEEEAYARGGDTHQLELAESLGADVHCLAAMGGWEEGTKRIFFDAAINSSSASARVGGRVGVRCCLRFGCPVAWLILFFSFGNFFFEFLRCG